MSRAQRVVVFVAVFFFVAAALYPPFVVEWNGESVRNWYFLFSGPPSFTSITEIDWSILIFEWCVILIAACCLGWASGSGSRSTEGERSSVP